MGRVAADQLASCAWRADILERILNIVEADAARGRRFLPLIIVLELGCDFGPWFVTDEPRYEDVYDAHEVVCIDHPPELPPPLLHYTFDDTLANSGTLGPAYDAVSHSARLVPGKFGSAVEVGEGGRFIEIPGSAAILRAARSVVISMWVREPEDAALGPPLIDCRSLRHGFHTYRGMGSGCGRTTCAGISASGYGTCGSFSRCGGHGWYHLLFRYPSTETDRTWELGVHVNGESVAWAGDADDVEVFGSTVEDIFLGKHHVGGFEPGSPWQIDDLRVYDVRDDTSSECVYLTGGRWCDRRCETD